MTELARQIEQCRIFEQLSGDRDAQLKLLGQAQLEQRNFKAYLKTAEQRGNSFWKNRIRTKSRCWGFTKPMHNCTSAQNPNTNARRR